ncbi:hypothetical protein L6452_44060 [Arctium lappa]|uniref:Uncharacterized protein n=1 Tax=Arctium lappa TaxID=4217 RepID=A0ACB8XF73_ARCLA|nr:hypothetical protein L6452_44060 [Arctium lappa]
MRTKTNENGQNMGYKCKRLKLQGREIECSLAGREEMDCNFDNILNICFVTRVKSEDTTSIVSQIGPAINLARVRSKIPTDSAKGQKSQFENCPKFEENIQGTNDGVGEAWEGDEGCNSQKSVGRRLTNRSKTRGEKGDGVGPGSVEGVDLEKENNELLRPNLLVGANIEVGPDLQSKRQPHSEVSQSVMCNLNEAQLRNEGPSQFLPTSQKEK